MYEQPLYVDYFFYFSIFICLPLAVGAALLGGHCQPDVHTEDRAAELVC